MNFKSPQYYEHSMNESHLNKQLDRLDRVIRGQLLITRKIHELIREMRKNHKTTESIKSAMEKVEFDIKHMALHRHLSDTFSAIRRRLTYRWR